MGKMLLGIAMTAREKGGGTLYVEYRRCDKCRGEYRLYFKSDQMVEEAFQELAKRLGNSKDEQDLCFSCQSLRIGDQVMMPLNV